MDRADLERLGREDLVQRAQAAGVRRARVLTRPELIDELLRRDPTIDETQLRKTRGFFGLARDLLSKVVERGLHLPDAAERLRVALGTTPLPQVPRPEPQVVPTVTLAEIYAAQGHKSRAIQTLERVLEAEPDHGAARSLLDRLEAADYVEPSPPLPPEPEEVREEIVTELEAPVTEDEPREDRPARTECIAIPMTEDASFVWWRLSASAENVVQDRSFVVRAVIIVPTWDGPQQETRDVAVPSSAGELTLEGLPARAVVRVAIGVLGPEDDFVPIAHSPALERSPSHGLVRWTTEGALPVLPEDPGAASIYRAADEALRVASELRG